MNQSQVALKPLYTYDPESNLYILTEEIGGYPISTPMVMTVAEYESFILKEQMSKYFREKFKHLVDTDQILKMHKKIYFQNFM